MKFLSSQRPASMSAHAILGLLELATTKGLDVVAALADAGCPHALDDIEGRVPWQIVEKITSAVIARIGIAGVLLATAAFRASRLSPLYYLARHSATVRLALTRVAKHYWVVSSMGDSRLVETSDSAGFELVQRDFLSASFKQALTGSWALNQVLIIRQLAGLDFEPREIWLESPAPVHPEEIDAYKVTLPFPLRFNAPCSAIAFEPQILERKVIDANPILETAIMRYVGDLEVRLPDDATLAYRLSQILVTSLRNGEHSVDTTARQLGTTARTMQRRLLQEGTSYQQVLDEVRHEIAVARMRAPKASPAAIAAMLGFDSTSSFHRAFKRWTGVTPGQFRKRAGTLSAYELDLEVAAEPAGTRARTGA